MKKTTVLFTLLAFASLAPNEGRALTLQEGLSIVSSHGWDVRIAENRQAAAEAAALRAAAPSLPEITLHAGHTWLAEQPGAVFGAGTVTPMADKASLTYGVSVRQMVYDFGRAGSMEDSARSMALASGVDTSRTRNAACRDFILAYVDLLESGKILAVADEEVGQFEAHRNDARVFFEEGVVTRNEVLQAEVMLSDARQRRLTARSESRMAQARINALLLRPLVEPVEPEEIIAFQETSVDLEEAFRRAESSRPEMAAVRHRIAAQEELLQAARSRFYPTVFLGGGYEYAENSYRSPEDNWSVTAGMTWDLYSGGARKASVREAEAELFVLQLEEGRLAEAVKLQVEDAFLALTSARERVQVAREAVGQAEENLRLQRLRFEEGEATATEVTDAVTLLTRAETNYWRASYGVQRATVLFLYAQGVPLYEAYLSERTPAPTATSPGGRS